MSGQLRAGGSEQPYFYVTVATAAVLRSSLSGKRLTTARAIYDALAEISNEARSSEFKAGRERLARYAGVTDRTVDAYGRLFVQLGLLEIVSRPGAANLWRLLEPGAIIGGETNRRGETNGTRGAKPTAARSEANSARFKKNNKEEKKVVPLRESTGTRARSFAASETAAYDTGVKPG